MRDEPFSDGGARGCIMGEDEETRTGRDMAGENIDGAAMQREECCPVERPGEARRGQREGGDARQNRHLLGRDMARQRRADPELHRIAGGEHADAPSPHLRDALGQRA